MVDPVQGREPAAGVMAEKEGTSRVHEAHTLRGEERKG